MSGGIDFGDNPQGTPANDNEKAALLAVLKGAKRVDFPANETVNGRVGEFAISDPIGGQIWLAVYTGDGITHSWGFSVLQTRYPS